LFFLVIFLYHKQNYNVLLVYVFQIIYIKLQGKKLLNLIYINTNLHFISENLNKIYKASSTNKLPPVIPFYNNKIFETTKLNSTAISADTNNFATFLVVVFLMFAFSLYRMCSLYQLSVFACACCRAHELCVCERVRTFAWVLIW